MPVAARARFFPLFCGAEARNQLEIQRCHTLAKDHIAKAKTAMDKFLQSVESNPHRRDAAEPCYSLHEPGDLVYGTALVFHGFGQSPQQCQLLADYLFDNGFNVYQPCLARHYLGNPTLNWPQVDLKPELKEKIRQNFLKDPVLAKELYISAEDTMQRVRSLSPEMSDIIAALDQGDRSQDFQRFFDSSHLDYFTEAEQRLEEVRALPGPIFAIGISMGGATALHLANTYPDTISKVVAYAPLLKTMDDARREFALAIGPLDVKETGWEPSLQFTVGCLVAIDLCGTRISQSNIDNLAKKVATLLLFTANEDSADLPTQEKFAQRLKAISSDGVPHLHYTYRRELEVPHAMIHPNERPIANKLWRRMYQETFRFLTTGKARQDELDSLRQDETLPQVP
ncbi:hypothetical protein SELMODRAFT_441277 [Selaginella moellendorffii]|uniref:Serine aminopeptidase S33 domain-containing protein n=1 Tax=Selaginella moellendorffii TaxID=88036 RepID=D8RI76_SELML|nr:uncharacterized protein LOC9633505 [Selaginella moellendorffii]EFJ28045.1 hypothetical protein SELMODRAFT_441277 [Selaginella moellendorffii]|eukprot:XP_002970719.1 uncharacterized protein LOC9633505 [Selaginella moellendorffii]